MTFSEHPWQHFPWLEKETRIRWRCWEATPPECGKSMLVPSGRALRKCWSRRGSLLLNSNLLLSSPWTSGWTLKRENKIPPRRLSIMFFFSVWAAWMKVSSDGVWGSHRTTRWAWQQKLSITTSCHIRKLVGFAVLSDTVFFSVEISLQSLGYLSSVIENALVSVRSLWP